jgi:flagellin
MSSLLTNVSAVAALQTLRSINSGLQDSQNHVATGLRVAKAADNAAYWSIATTMRSDNKAISAVSDALGVSAAKLDTAYAGMSQVLDILGEFKAKLVAAKEDGVDKSKVQDELDQLKQQVASVAMASSFNGTNYLQTDISDMFDPVKTEAAVASAYVRGSEGVSVTSTTFDLGKVSLFNSTGGGLLQADPRDVGTIGGLRYERYWSGDSLETMSTSSLGNTSGSSPSHMEFYFTGPMDFSASDEISFDVVVDADNPADGISAPYDPGRTPAHVVINQATVNAELGVTDGHIETYTDYTRVINRALRTANAYASASNYTHPEPPDQDKIYVPTIDKIGIYRFADPAKNGSSFEIKNFTSSIAGSGGLHDTNGIWYGQRSSSMTLDFEPFTVAHGVVIGFSFGIDRETQQTYSFDKDYIDNLLGKTDGKVETAAEMTTLLQSFITRPDVIIEDNGSGGVSVRTNVLLDRKSGEKSGIGFTGINVNIEPIPHMNFMDIDIEQNPEGVGSYLQYIEIVSKRITSGASILGSVSQRVDMQTNFTHSLMDSISSGIGRLVDADLEKESSRLAAQQTQQQLAIQSLSIANSAPNGLLSLFR